MSNPISQDIDLSLLNSSESESGSLNGVEAPEEAEIQVIHESGPEVEVISGPTPVVRARAPRGPPAYEVVGARALEDAPPQSLQSPHKKNFPMTNPLSSLGAGTFKAKIKEETVVGTHPEQKFGASLATWHCPLSIDCGF